MIFKILEKLLLFLRELVCKCAVYCSCGSDCVKQDPETKE